MPCSFFQKGAAVFRIVHHEIRAVECSLPVRRRGDDKHDISPRGDLAVAVDGCQAERARTRSMARFAIRLISASAMPGIVFEFKRCKPTAFIAAQA